jgi:type III restriction enzyme
VDQTRGQGPPCFIVVCQNTSISKLVYDYISGFHRTNEDGSTTLENGRLTLFQNFDEHGNPLARPNTLLIDSEEIESGDALDDNFRSMAADEIERFRREIIERTGGRQQAENITDQELLREVCITAGITAFRNDGVLAGRFTLQLYSGATRFH